MWIVNFVHNFTVVYISSDILTTSHHCCYWQPSLHSTDAMLLPLTALLNVLSTEDILNILMNLLNSVEHHSCLLVRQRLNASFYCYLYLCSLPETRFRIFTCVIRFVDDAPKVLWLLCVVLNVKEWVSVGEDVRSLCWKRWVIYLVMKFHILNFCLSNTFDRLSNHFGFCLYVCPPIGCRTISSAVHDRFSPNFACRSEMWLFRRLLFLRQTGSRLPILEVCKIRFWQFRDCGGHIFPWKNANFGRFEVAFDRPKFDRTQQCMCV